MRARISHAGILTCLGDLETSWQSLLNCKSGLSKTSMAGMVDEWPLGIIPDLPGPLGSFARQKNLLARIFTDLPSLPPETGLVCATTKGAIDELLTEPEPANGQCYQLAGQLAGMLNLTTQATTVSAACASGTIAIIQAALKIESGEYKQVLVVGLDLVSRFVLGGFASLKALALEGCSPFDKNRNGLSLGEAGGWLLLCDEKSCLRKNSPFSVKIDSWGISCDATHITAPCRKASGLISCLQELKKNSSVKIGAINGHGTGTVYNDAMELLAFTSALDPELPLHSVKGAIGHTLGAAGLVETAFCLKSLEQGIIPPTVGLRDPESDSVLLSGVTPLPLKQPSIINCNSGFGGINAAILFK